MDWGADGSKVITRVDKDGNVISQEVIPAVQSLDLDGNALPLEGADEAWARTFQPDRSHDRDFFDVWVDLHPDLPRNASAQPTPHDPDPGRCGRGNGPHGR